VTHSTFKREQENLRVNEQFFGWDVNHLLTPRIIENDSTQRMTAFLKNTGPFFVNGRLASDKTLGTHGRCLPVGT
jgi:hypothetical protein